jgi:hypothetical protein
MVATEEVWLLVALACPPEFAAVTTTRTVEETSDAVS